MPRGRHKKRRTRNNLNPFKENKMILKYMVTAPVYVKLVLLSKNVMLILLEGEAEMSSSPRVLL